MTSLLRNIDPQRIFEKSGIILTEPDLEEIAKHPRLERIPAEEVRTFLIAYLREIGVIGPQASVVELLKFFVSRAGEGSYHVLEADFESRPWARTFENACFDGTTFIHVSFVHEATNRTFILNEGSTDAPKLLGVFDLGQELDPQFAWFKGIRHAYPLPVILTHYDALVENDKTLADALVKDYKAKIRDFFHEQGLGITAFYLACPGADGDLAKLNETVIALILDIALASSVYVLRKVLRKALEGFIEVHIMQYPSKWNPNIAQVETLVGEKIEAARAKLKAAIAWAAGAPEGETGYKLLIIKLMEIYFELAALELAENFPPALAAPLRALIAQVKETLARGGKETGAILPGKDREEILDVSGTQAPETLSPSTYRCRRCGKTFECKSPAIWCWECTVADTKKLAGFTEDAVPASVKTAMRKGYIFKVVVVGAASKTSLVLRYTQHKFSEHYVMASGSNFAIAEVKLPGGQLCKLQIWDLAGKPHFSLVRPPFYKGASAVILVYDVTDRKSLDELKDWKEDFIKYLPPETIMYVLANKGDLKDERVVSTEEGKKAAEALGASGFWETSEKTGENVQTLFNSIATTVLASYLQTSILDNNREKTVEKIVKTGAGGQVGIVGAPRVGNREDELKMLIEGDVMNCLSSAPIPLEKIQERLRIRQGTPEFDTLISYLEKLTSAGAIGVEFRGSGTKYYFRISSLHFPSSREICSAVAKGTVGLVGPPNVGKMTILRQFVKYVEEGLIPEVTKDIECSIVKMDFAGEPTFKFGEDIDTHVIHPYRVVFREDTTGINHTLFAPEDERIRAFVKMGIYNISKFVERIIVVFDLSRGLDAQFEIFTHIQKVDVLRFYPKEIAVCLNKYDLLADRSDDQAVMTIDDYRAKITAFFAGRQIAVIAFYTTCAETNEAYREYTDAAISMILDVTVRDGS